MLPLLIAMLFIFFNCLFVLSEPIKRTWRKANNKVNHALRFDLAEAKTNFKKKINLFNFHFGRWFFLILWNNEASVKLSTRNFQVIRPSSLSFSLSLSLSLSLANIHTHTTIIQKLEEYRFNQLFDATVAVRVFVKIHVTLPAGRCPEIASWKTVTVYFLPTHTHTLTQAYWPDIYKINASSQTVLCASPRQHVWHIFL